MGRLGFDNDTEFIIQSNRLDSIIVDEPKNWNEDEKSYERSPIGGGTLLKLNTKLEFRKDGYNYIKGLLSVFGYNTTATVLKNGKDVTSLGEKWRNLYAAKLDLMAAKFLKNTVQVPFTQGGLFDKINARYSDTYDLVSTKSADNIDIGELSTIKENNYGRSISRRSKLKVDDEVQSKLVYKGGDREAAVAVPFQIVTNSDQDYINGISDGANSVGRSNDTYATGQVGAMLYDRSNRYKELFLNGNISLILLDTDNGNLFLDVVYYTYNNATDTYEFKNKVELATTDSGQTLGEINYSFDNYQINLEEGESVALVVRVRADNGGGDIVFEYQNTTLEIKLDDLFSQTESKVLLPFELFQRLIQKITGEDRLLISNVFGRVDLGYAEDGKWAYLCTTSGFFARGFDIGEPIRNVDGELIDAKQYNITLKDAFDSYNCIEPLFWGIEVKNQKEYVRIENYDFTQQDFIGIRLGRTVNGQFRYIPAQKPETTILEDELFTKLEFGYEKGGNNYEEVIGLTSVHGKAQYNTCLSEKEESVYSRVSKIRADVEGHELARIKQARQNPDEDTPYDQDLFFRDLIKEGFTYRLRTYNDDFTGAPIGGSIYSPETMGNLRLTPFRNLLRHKRIIGTGLYQEPFSKLTFISSNCLSSFTLDGLQEDGAINNSELLDPYINGMMLSLEGKVYQYMIDQIEGFTEINGERIPNWYGLMEISLNGELVQGRLIKSSINGNGKHEIALIP